MQICQTITATLPPPPVVQFWVARLVYQMKPGNTKFCLNLKMYGTEMVQGNNVENS